mmetsp:Transcript_66139/g.103276  ORF Transcript_66139/g.103276 Transcript_66139/m.103276 type:complete len:199 (+) Transcript_66139:54-650(+)
MASQQLARNTIRRFVNSRHPENPLGIFAAALRAGPHIQRRYFAAKEPLAPAAQDGGSVASSNDKDAWRSDTEKYWELQKLQGGRAPQGDLRMGAYATEMQVDPVTKKVTPVSKFFVSPRKDPVTFVVNCILAFVTVWTISQLSWGESFFEKRKRVIRERIRQEYGLPKGWEHEIEEDSELQLSDTAPSGSAAAAAAPR